MISIIGDITTTTVIRDVIYVTTTDYLYDKWSVMI
jgi:hypothetical protein